MRDKVLIQSWQDEKNKKNLQELIDLYKPLILKIVKKNLYYSKSLSFYDLYQEGVIGLIQAASKFEIERNISFASYAKWWVLSSVQSYIFNNFSIVKPPSTQKNIFFQISQFEKKIENIKDFVDEALLRKMLEQIYRMRNHLDVSLERKKLLDVLREDSFSPEENILKAEKNMIIKNVVKESLEHLTTQEKFIVTHHFQNKKLTLENIGKTLNLTKERVRQIEKKALEKMMISIKEKNSLYEIKNFF